MGEGGAAETKLSKPFILLENKTLKTKKVQGLAFRPGQFFRIEKFRPFMRFVMLVMTQRINLFYLG